MTNEEIFKYALKQFGNKRENTIIGIVVLGIIGSGMMFVPYSRLDYCDFKSTIVMAVAIVLFAIVYIKGILLLQSNQKDFRNFHSNLVRKDERKRIEGKK